MSVECHPILNLNPDGGTTQLRDRDYKIVAGITTPEPPHYSSFISEFLDFNLNTKRRRRKEYIRKMKSNDPSQQLEGIKQLDKLISQDLRLRDVGSRAVGDLLGFLKHRGNPELQYYATGVLSAVVPYEGELIKNEAVPLLVDLLNYQEEKDFGRMQFQALSALTVIVCVVPGSWEVIIRNGALKLFLDIAISMNYPDLDYRLKLKCANFFSVICREMPDSSPKEITDLAFHIGKILVEWEYPLIIAKACFALSYVSYKRCVEVEEKTCKLLLWIMSCPDPIEAAPALDVIGNIVRWSNDDQTQLMVDNGVLPRLRLLLRHKHKKFRKEACMIIANIIAKKKTTTEDVIEADLVVPLRILSEKDEVDIKEEAMSAIFNVYFGANSEQLRHLIQIFSKPLSGKEIEDFLNEEVVYSGYHRPVETYHPKNW